MDIEYDPTETDEDDEILGTLDYNHRQDKWVLTCDEHGLLKHSRDGSAEEHDDLVRRWALHDRDYHGGDGKMTPDLHSMLIGNERD